MARITSTVSFRNKITKLFSLLAIVTTLSFANAAPVQALKLNKELTLSTFSGSTFFEAMTASGGIKELLDADLKTSFTVADKATIHAAVENFEPGVYKKVVRFFSDGDAGFDALVDALEGQALTPATAASAIGTQLKSQQLLADASKVGLAAVTIAPLLAMASGAGTVVEINADNYYYNYGYRPGSHDATQLAKDVKSGRSFGAGPNHKALDASDVFYLTELGTFLNKTKDPSDFYRALFHVLVQNDTADYEKVSELGQTVATDFFAIYTAELDRHVMAELKAHPWENDLAEVTLLSAYGTAAGMVEKDGSLVDGVPKDYFGVGKSGSGIGETRRDRRALQAQVTDAERTLHPEIVAKLEKLSGTKAGGDVIRGVMEHLNSYDTQEQVHSASDQLTEAAIEFLQQIRSDAKAITKAIQG